MRFLASIVVAGLALACRPEPDPCEEMWRPMEPDGGPREVDPTTVFSDYGKSWPGTVHWRTGDSSPLVFSGRFEAAEPIVVTEICGINRRFDQSIPAEILSEDGWVAELGMHVGLRWPNSTAEWEQPNVNFTRPPISPRIAAIVQSFAGTDPTVFELKLRWNLDPDTKRYTAPFDGKLRAIRTAPPALANESIEVGTLAFE